MILVIAALAVHRIARVITTDPFPPTMALRVRVANRWPPPSWQSKLITCIACMSFWVGCLVTIALIPVVDFHPIVFGLMPFAFSSAATLIETFT